MGQGPLCEKAIGPIPEHQLDWEAYKFVNQHGQWNWSLFEPLLPATELMKIAATMPPNQIRGEDRRRWEPSEGGDFSFRSAYNLIENTPQGPNSSSRRTKREASLRMTSNNGC
ncbi:OLC1v1027911C1 [Oldenlandia corymbosa var. corymbosa]|uniref:OLC1v1027911C1 n=1 Tax=Oldenlandia corymbosa var. corymbosa TaxID=529605 RepID=A0AAV1CD89_OLDCO|nr:OLC1v1027911C1 [Oldenlandia corymbosa var. corymbosa]